MWISRHLRQLFHMKLCITLFHMKQLNVGSYVFFNIYLFKSMIYDYFGM